MSKTRADMQADFLASPRHDAKVEAMEALFAFAAAVNDGGLSIQDLADTMRVAIEGGHDMLKIDLAMASIALNMVTEEGA